ncbi:MULTISPECIES: SRPBCC family protein [Niastella]|uniref:SRPBCC family protein n=1 Tax=Niastella soli TaxID=2821487 RepID=A0ABS3YPL1_9BACT|nr:SRPBCC family protein [Niastella soli]MBO9199822.1 SRPBCC family protein [Niastella soli]
MPTIHLTTFIAAPIERVFDLSRSIDLHKKSMTDYREEAVAGTVMGLINLNESVTWKAKHLMKTRVLQVQITAMQRPFSFTDEMKKGDFKSMKHEHHFKAIENGTLMIDVFKFEAPFGGLGRFFSSLYLSGYLEKLLEQRNDLIKEYAEGNKWKHVLDNKQGA